MNIKEINDGAPKWTAVVALGLPLAVLTVAIPLAFNFRYRKVKEYINRRPRFVTRVTLGLGIVGVVGTVVTVVILLKTGQNK